ALGPGHVNLGAVVAPADRVAVELLELELLERDRVERELAGAGPPPLERVSDGPARAALVDVDPQIDVEVDRLDLEVRRIVCRGRRQGEVARQGEVGAAMMMSAGRVVAPSRVALTVVAIELVASSHVGRRERIATIRWWATTFRAGPGPSPRSRRRRSRS